jgi:hypothetical protein
MPSSWAQHSLPHYQKQAKTAAPQFSLGLSPPLALAVPPQHQVHTHQLGSTWLGRIKLRQRHDGVPGQRQRLNYSYTSIHASLARLRYAINVCQGRLPAASVLQNYCECCWPELCVT